MSASDPASRILLAEVARALGDLVDRVVFIGGAVAPLLQIGRAFAAPRPTGDVDAIAVTASYSDFEALCQRLRQRGFRETMDSRHAHRWTTPGSLHVPLDLVPIGVRLGASGNPWDEAVLRTAVIAEIEPGLTIRHASAPAFLALKLAAFGDRGREDPFASDDLEDILALVASRPQIVEEVLRSPDAIRLFVWERMIELLTLVEYEDLLAAHLGNVARASAAIVIPETDSRLREMARA